LHLATLRSFGVPYLSPVAPFSAEGQKDMAVRAPWWAMSSRPPLVGMAAPQREAAGLKPTAPPTRERR